MKGSTILVVFAVPAILVLCSKTPFKSPVLWSTQAVVNLKAIMKMSFRTLIITNGR